MAIKKNDKTKNSKRRKIFWSLFSSILVILFLATFFFIQYVVEGLPSLEQLENPKQSLASNVFSDDGEMIGQYFRQNRVETKIDSIPAHLIKALIATEDRKFYDHWGVDLERFVKAMFKTVFLFKKEGASTITQQLSKNLYEFWVADESLFDTVVRKVREWITAVQIEKTYTKKEILEMYLNESYFGKGAYGIETAARLYFNKKAKDLTIPESAVFVALLKSPSFYDPERRYNNAVERRNLVMYNMVVVGDLDNETYQRLKLEPIELSMDQEVKGFQSKYAPHFVEYVRQQLSKIAKEQNFDLYEDGLTIYTTLDTRYQAIANRAVSKHLNEFQEQFDKYWKWSKNKELLDDLLDKAIKRRSEYRKADSQLEKDAVYEILKNNVAFVDSVQKIAETIEVGFVVLDVKTGEIRAMIGGRNQKFSYGLNHVTQIKRQPGSSFKPIVYTVALDNGLYPAYPILNQKFDYNGWSPDNFDKSVSGFLTLRDAIKNSVNIVSARLIIEGYAPTWQILKYASKMGVESSLDPVPALSLGAAEVTPLELTSVYATIANRGIYNEPMSITRIEDKDGILIYSSSPISTEAISEETSFMITSLLRNVVDEGTAIRVRGSHNFQRPAGGKTGTTQDYADAWFMGFTPQLAAGVWVGFDDRRITFTGSYGQGARAALPIWGYFMHDLYETVDLPLEDFEVPTSGDIVRVNFCRESIYEFGDPKLTSSDCKTGTLTDWINIKDIPDTFNAQKDTTIKIFDKYLIKDSLRSHEAQEIK